MSDQYAAGAESAVKTNPALANDPAAVNYATQQRAYDAAGISQVMKLSGVHNGILQGMQHSANSNPVAGDWWSGLTHFGEGLFSGTVDLLKGAFDVARRSAVTTAEIGSLGAYGDKGWFHFGANLKDAYDTAKNVSQYLNPVNDWNLARHVAAYYETMYRRKGLTYLLGDATPQVIASLFGGEVLTGAGMASEAVDVANLAKLQKLIDAGTATEEDLARFTSISARMARRSDATARFDEATAQNETNAAELAAKQSAQFNRGKTIFYNKPLRWTFGLPAKGLKMISRGAGSIRMNSFYAMTGASAQADPAHKAMWEMTSNGQVYDANNRAVGSVGQNLADSFGLHGVSKSLVSGAIDFGTSMASDPFALAGNLRMGAKSAEGVGGLLGRWWKGIGVENSNDVYRLYNSRPDLQKTFQFMADSTASEIDKAMKGMYPSKVTLADGRELDILGRLGRAKTADEVAAIHAEIADSYHLTRNVMPTLSIYRRVASAIRGFLGVARPLDEPSSRLADEFQQRFDELGISVKPKDVAEASRADLGAKGSVLARRWLGKNITEVPWLIMEAERNGELPTVSSAVFRMGDPNAIEPLLNQMRMTGLWSPFEIDNLEVALRESKTPTDFFHTYMNLSGAMVEAAIARLTDKAIYDALHIELRQEIRDRIYSMMELGGGGGPGIYVNGKLGKAYSEAYHFTDSTRNGFYGIGYTHLAEAHFLDPRELVGMVDKMAKALMSTDIRIVNEANRLRELSEFELRQAAEFKGASLEGFSYEMNTAAKDAVAQFAGNAGEDALKAGYQSANDELATFIDRTHANPAMTDAVKYTTATKEVSNVTMQLEKDLASLIRRRDNELVQQEKDIRDALNQSPPDYQKLAEASNRVITPMEKIHEATGRLTAFRDYEAGLVKKVSEPNMGLEDFRKAVWQPEKVSDEARKASLAVRKDITEKLDKLRVKKTSYMDRRSFTNDALNKLQTRMFIPQMLSSGGYIMRIGISELLPNILRIGPRNYIASRLAASIVKHEYRGLPLAETVDSEGRVLSEKALISQHVLSVAETLMEKPDTFNSFLIGALTGAEKLILESISPERFGRMVDDFAGALMSCNGHLPDVGHMTSQLFNSEGISQGMSKMVHGIDEETGEPTASLLHHGPGWTTASGEHGGTALSHNLARVHVDKIFLECMKDLRDVFMSRGSYELTNAEFNQIHEMLTEKVYRRLVAMPEKERAMFWRNEMVLTPELSTGEPIRDWAKAVAYNNLSLVHGIKNGKFLFHQELMDQAITGQIMNPQQMARWMKDQNGAHPTHLVYRELTKYPWDSHGVSVFNSILNGPQKFNALTVDKAFGRLIPWISREPVFLWEYHMAMEDMRSHIVNGVISQDVAELQALNQAFRRMTSFIHNPADRVMFERNTRAIAPFWFAKNQAFRRAFRLLEDNPAAFDYYIKLCMMGTHYLQRHEAGQNDTIAIPGSSWLPGVFGYLGGGADPMFSSLGFDLHLNPSSLRTLFVTGDKSGFGSLMPDFGTYVSVFLKSIGYLTDNKSYKNFVATVLGPVGSNTGVMADFIANPLLRGLLTEGIDLGLALRNRDPVDTYTMQVNIETARAAFDNKAQSYVNEWIATHPNDPHDKLINDAISYSDMKMNQLVNNTAEWDKFMFRVRTSSLGVYLSKLIAGFSAPAAASLRNQFSKYPEFNKIAKEKGPDGKPISFQEAAYKFSIEYPNRVIDLMSSSNTPFGSFAENKSYTKYASGNEELISQLPNFAAAIFPKTGSYDSAARADQIARGLRSPENADEFRRSLAIQEGNDFYYRYIMPMFYQDPQYGGQWYGENDPRNRINAKGYDAMISWARNWGKHNNPFWLEGGSPLGYDAKVKQAKAYSDADAFLRNPSLQRQAVQSGLLTQTDINNLGTAMTYYNNQMTIYNNTSSRTHKWTIEQNIYQYMNNAAEQLKGTNVAYFLSSVLAKMPTK